MFSVDLFNRPVPDDRERTRIAAERYALAVAVSAARSGSARRRRRTGAAGGACGRLRHLLRRCAPAVGRDASCRPEVADGVTLP